MLDVSMAEYVVESLAWRARKNGSHLFGALLVDPTGNLVLEAENTVVTGPDCTGHAETNLMRMASWRFSPEFLHGCTLYTSTEPCAMCAGAIYWGNVQRVVFALSEEELRDIVGRNPEPNSGHALPGGIRAGPARGRSWPPHFSTRRGRCTRASGAEPRPPRCRRAVRVGLKASVEHAIRCRAPASLSRVGDLAGRGSSPDLAPRERPAVLVPGAQKRSMAAMRSVTLAKSARVRPGTR